MPFTIRIPTALLQLPSKIKPGEELNWSKKNIKEKSEEEIVINVAEELSIPANSIFKYLKVSLGERVAKGGIIAEKKGLFSSSSIVAPATAEVRALDHLQGSITLVAEGLVEVPFAFRGHFVKKVDSEYVFSVAEGAEYELNFSTAQTVGGKCVYIDDEKDIASENCENNIVVLHLDSAIAAAKTSAMNPQAIVTYKSSYYNSEVVQLYLKHKSDWTELLKNKFPMCLYLSNSKNIFFYKN